ncbi:MAG: hypothetical protein MZV49_04420 [Rhodopseudomonas palustris]|nr:hypothetical protein [Rhodopseudomonas palustris]
MKQGAMRQDHRRDRRRHRAADRRGIRPHGRSASPEADVEEGLIDVVDDRPRTCSRARRS